MNMKTEFLVLYDYGMGGTWRYLRADSESQIAELYPELEVVKERPSWLDDAREEKMCGRTADIDDVTDPFLTALRRARRQ
jgi:hypothetical protein